MKEVTKYEGVTFVNSAVKGMSRTRFVEAHINLFWKDMTETARKKMLGRVYELIAGPQDEQ